MKQAIKILVTVFALLFGFSMQSQAQKISLTWEQVKRMCGVPVDTVQMKIEYARGDSMYKAYLSQPKPLVTQQVPNWRSMMGPVAYQDTDWCSADCWAHSGAGLAEGQLHISIGSNIGIFLDASDIVHHLGCSGCPSDALNYIGNSKAISYVSGSPGTYPNLFGVRWGIAAIGTVSGISSIQEALVYGPVSACFYVYDDFYDFFDSNPYAVYRTTQSGNCVGHAVVIVSYDNTQQCWLCKNSWGNWWADGGYFRIGYDQCCIDSWQNCTAVVSQSCYAKLIPNLIPSLASYGFVNGEWAYVSANQTVNNGQTLNITPGSSVIFQPSTSFTVNGTLNAMGTTSQPITFTSSSGTWGGIQFNSGSSGSLVSYSIISDASNGIYENGVTVSMWDCAIKNCTNGIYLYDSSPNISYSNIYNNSYAGIYSISSSPYLYNNYIQNNDYGVYCTTSSNPSFGWGGGQGMNNITNNSYGVFCWNNSLPMLGQSSPLNGGYNNLVNTSWNVYNMSSGSIYAQNNWWGTTNTQNFKIAGTGGVAYNPYLSSAVSISAPPLNNSVSTPYASTVSDVSLLSELSNAYQLVASNDLVGARSICLSLITNYPDSSVSFNALNLLKDTYPSTNLPVLRDAYNSLFHNKEKKELYAMAGLMMAGIDTANHLNLIDSVINTYKGNSVVELALFDKFVYYYFEKGDKQNALEVSEEIDTLFPQSQGSVEAHSILGDQVSGGVNASGEQTPERIATQTSTEYSLSNYPNPFNPTTTISYNLSTSGHVTLKVYDILGREVKTLVNEDESAGYHNAVFDANRLASGVYFYRLTAPGIVVTKKMVVTK